MSAATAIAGDAEALAVATELAADSAAEASIAVAAPKATAAAVEVGSALNEAVRAAPFDGTTRPAGRSSTSAAAC